LANQKKWVKQGQFGKAEMNMVGFEKKWTSRPRLVLSYVDSLHAARTARHLRRLGWEVHLASSADEVYRVVRELAPSVVVLDTELQEESGWLIAAKLGLEPSAPRIVVLTANDATTHARRMDEVDAVVSRSASIESLLSHIVGSNLAHAV
jgi:DNA-binding response OmpR family regulator